MTTSSPRLATWRGLLTTKLSRTSKRIARTWAAVHVDRHGAYSVERLQQLHEYQSSTSLLRAWAVVVLAPLPCLAAATLLDAIPIAPPSLGLAHSQSFWLRSFLLCWIINTAILSQLRWMVPRLPVMTAQIIWIPPVAALFTVAYALVLASEIGFPLPFTCALGAPAQCLVYGACGFVSWGDFLRRNRDVRNEIVQYYVLVVKQVTLVYFYAGFSYAFNSSHSDAQPAFALLLPIVKLAAKNWISRSVKQVEDFKPEIVIFNVEIFHSLFVAISMQTATSTTTVLLLVALDFFHACLSLHRMRSLARLCTRPSATEPSSTSPRFTGALTSSWSSRVEPVGATSSHGHPVGFIRFVLCVLKTDPSILRSRRIRSYMNSLRRHSAVVMQAVQAGPHAPSTASANKMVQIFPSSSVGVEDNFSRSPGGFQSHRDEAKLQRPSFSDAEKRLVNSLTTAERCERVQGALRLLHMSEFVVLIEYTEVMIPVVYCFYLVIMSRLSNRVYYDHLKDLDADQLIRNISNVLLYTFLELVSFLAIGAALGKQLGMSTIHQAAFVLENQWQMVQAKLIIWVVFTLQSPLEHFGADYSFQFKWLRSGSHE